MSPTESSRILVSAFPEKKLNPFAIEVFLKIIPMICMSSYATNVPLPRITNTYLFQMRQVLYEHGIQSLQDTLEDRSELYMFHLDMS